MTLTAYPCKLSPEELETRLAGGMLPLPGQVLRLDGRSPSYVQVLSVQADLQQVDGGTIPSSRSGTVLCRILHGRPSMTPAPAHILSSPALRNAFQSLQGAINHPLSLAAAGSFDFFRLGALTVIQGEEFSSQYTALTLLMQGITPYQKILLLDPLGMALPGEGIVCLHAGEDFRLSLQNVGSKQFLDNFAQLLPQTLQEAGLRTLANLLPTSMQSFIGFQSLFALERLAEAPLRNLILQNLHTMDQARIFANTPDDVFSLEKPLPQPISILDLSVLTEPWKSLFYAEICRHVIHTAGGDITLALIHPEHYLPDLPAQLRQAEEAELTILALSSPYGETSHYGTASNRLWAKTDTRLLLQGKLTLGLPIEFSLSGETDELPEQPEQEEEKQEIHALPLPAPSRKPPPMQETASIVDETPALSTSASIHEETLPVVSPASDFLEESNSPISISEVPTLVAEETTNWNPEPEALENETEPEESFPFTEISEPDALESGQHRKPEDEEKEPEAFQAELSVVEEELFIDDTNPSEDTDILDEEDWLPDFDASLIPMTPGENEPSLLTLSQTEASSEPNSPEGEFLEEDDDALFFDFDPDLGNDLLLSDTAEPTATLAGSSSPVAQTPSPPMPEELSYDKPPPPPEIEAPPFVDETPPIHQRETNLPDKMLQESLYQPGDRVHHPTYGSGVVLKVLPMAEQVILNITFDQVGKRLLDPSLCQLTRDADEDRS